MASMNTSVNGWCSATSNIEVQKKITRKATQIIVILAKKKEWRMCEV